MTLKPGHAIEEAQEYASLYVLKALPPEESDSFETHISEGCRLCRQEVQAMESALGELGVLSSATPPPGLRERLLERVRSKEGAESQGGPQVWKNWDTTGITPDGGVETQPGWSSVRAEDTDWEETGLLGINVRRLHVDTARQYVTMLVRMEPGASYLPHRHHDAEECFVLEGELTVGGEVFRRGDYQRAEAGSVHGVQSTETGCTLLILSSTRDIILP